MDLLAFTVLLVAVSFLTGFIMRNASRADETADSARGAAAPESNGTLISARAEAPSFAKAMEKLFTGRLSLREALLLWRRATPAIIVVLLLDFVVLGMQSNPNPWTQGMAELGSASLRWYSSLVVLCLVVAVVVFGIYMSMHQFESWIREKQLRQGLAQTAAASATPEALTVFKLAAGKITLSTPIAGFFVLLLSLGFLYLFVWFESQNSPGASPLPVTSATVRSPAPAAQHHAAVSKPTRPLVK